MADKQTNKRIKRQRRHRRVRARVFGTAEKPRLCVYRSLLYIYAQVIDDEKGQTLVSVTDHKVEGGKKSEKAAKVGEEIAKKATAKGITEVVFDRGGCRYQGRVKALAEGARKGGLKF